MINCHSIGLTEAPPDPEASPGYTYVAWDEKRWPSSIELDDSSRLRQVDQWGWHQPITDTGCHPDLPC